MSLLLDALRKSEKRRKGGSPPPLGLPTGPGAGEPARSRRSSGRRLGLILLIVLGLLAIAVAAWWGAGRPGQDRITAWLAPSTTAQSTDAEAEPAGEPERQLVADAYRRPEPDASDVRSAESATPVAAPSTSNRTDDPSGMSQSTNAPRSQPAATGGADDAANPGAGTVVASAEPDPTQRAAEPEPAGTPPRSAESNGGREREILPARPVAQSARPGPTPESSNEPIGATTRDNTVAPWDLPAAVRGDFPSIDVAVHFYADDPSDRFVLIDGERYGEGDAITGGVELAEIRRSGIVVEYRSYRIRIE